MKDQLPSPDPDSSHYVRPTRNWICGKAAEGFSCRIGPDAHGRCRASCECVPILEVKEGETKGRYKCTRPAEYGGPCESGPLPNGTCCRAITRCQPVRTLRSRRQIFVYAVIVLTTGLLLVALGGEQRWRFINPGGLSMQHSGSGFSDALHTVHAGMSASDPGCAACHVAARVEGNGWVKTALSANPGPLHVHTLALMTTAQMTTIDENCERCHLGHTFHEPNVVEDHSCSACHQEHMGNGPMKKPLDSNCLTCHANADIMQASYEKGTHLDAALFDFRPDNGRNLFRAPRPERGYTKVIHSFATDHPEFQVMAEKLKDPDTLRFNHKLHLTSTTVGPSPLTGKKLVCADCHQPDGSGKYYRKISFEQNCRACHSLLFDAHNPDLHLPHGNPEATRNFLRSLPAQYTEKARGKLHLTTKADLESFVNEQMRLIREQAGSGEQLEHAVFFGDSSEQRARFPSCTYCHTVAESVTAASAPVVVKPVIMDRWLIRGSFDHSKHLPPAIECSKCHDVLNSAETSDVLLPSQKTCVDCHSPKGGVANGCSTCHSYHAPQKTTGTVASSLLGAPIKLADKERD